MLSILLYTSVRLGRMSNRMHCVTRAKRKRKAGLMKALKCGTLGASFGKPCASDYVEGILDEYIHSIVRMYTVRRGNLGRGVIWDGVRS